MRWWPSRWSWVNDLWMAVFFFPSAWRSSASCSRRLASLWQALLPAGAALGGMVVPALITWRLNRGDAVARCAAGPSHRHRHRLRAGHPDAAGLRVPASLKVFLTAVAIIDDLGAIVVIALFTTRTLAAHAGRGCVGAAVLFANRARVTLDRALRGGGRAAWLCDAGRACTPRWQADLPGPLPMRRRRQLARRGRRARDCTPGVAFLVLPDVVRFANAGVSLQGVTPASFGEAVPLGIALGAVAGKAIGVFGARG